MTDTFVRGKGADVAMMARIRNEERWIGRNLKRTLEVCGTVVLWDDGSTDKTVAIAHQTMAERATMLDADFIIDTTPMGEVLHLADRETREVYQSLHVLESPFRRTSRWNVTGSATPVRAKEQVNEIRDKNLLWYYLKSQVKFRHVLCLDGDEMLSLAALRGFPAAIAALESGVDIIDLPFVYVWDDEGQQRTDAIYGDAADSFKRLRFPRLFTIDRLDEQQLFDTHFAWGGNRGGFHCGSVPQQDFMPGGVRPSPEAGTRGFMDLPVVHFGYFDKELRERKFEFYNMIDPDNEVEGRYLHIIGQPNVHAPGQVALAPWRDE